MRWSDYGKTNHFNVERMIAAVAAEHRLLLKPDDAAFAIVTMNRLVLEESLEAIRAVVNQDLAQFKETAQWAHSRAESAIEEEVRRSSRAHHGRNSSAISITHDYAPSEIVQEVKETYERADGQDGPVHHDPGGGHSVHYRLRDGQGQCETVMGVGNTAMSSRDPPEPAFTVERIRRTSTHGPRRRHVPWRQPANGVSLG